MPAIFINYRREESAGEARALYNKLVERLGDDAVFIDVDGIAPGQDFRDVVQQRLSSCDLMLALVGKEWLTVTSRSGGRRLDDPVDYVRLEIEAALKRKIPVAPVLLHGTQMPSPDQLPEALRDFAFRNAFELSHTRWESDVQEMVRRLALLDKTPRAPQSAAAQRAPADPTMPVAQVAGPPPRSSSGSAGLWAGLAAVLLILAAGGYVFFGRAPATAAPVDASVVTEDLAAVTVLTGAAMRDLLLSTQLTGPESCLDHLTIGPCGAFSGQVWSIEPAASGRIRLRNAFAGAGKCLDVVNDGVNDKVDMANCGEFTGQYWYPELGQANRFVRLRNDFTGPDKCLAVVGFNGRTGDLRLMPCADAPAQSWRIAARQALQ